MRSAPSFLELPAPVGRPAAVVVPVPWERSTSYLAGTARGPEAILEASTQVELYDEELDVATWRAGIATGKEVDLAGGDPHAALDAIAAAVDDVLGNGALPVILGGEHTATVGAVRAAAGYFPELAVLQVDAHADLRDSYRDDRWSHACTMARVREICPHVGVGIRALSSREAALIRKSAMPIWYARDCRGPDWIDAVVAALGDPVWVTFDLDGLDPSVVPAVGTPEPGGLSWRRALDLLRAVASRRRIVGFDIVELCPDAGGCRSAFAAARLTYRLIGYALTRGGTRALPVAHGIEPEDLE